MEPFQLATSMEFFLPEMLLLDGLIFLDKFAKGEAALLEEALTYENLAVAQNWMNTLLFDRFVTELVGEEWELNDPFIKSFIEVFRRAWLWQAAAKYPDAKFVIEQCIDDDAGDLGLRLVNIND
jgi:hypothetical protein